MDRYYRLSYFFLILLLTACAQVGSISGGPKDTTPPRVKKLTPENKMTNFSGRKIVYQFDEFIKLNNPNENLLILPAGPKVTASVFKKELTLEIEGELAPNTTYQISLNGLVKDNREGNDSLMRYVFSTGEFLDSISFTGKIVDAYTNELQANQLVGLYKAADSITSKPLYFVKTDTKGVFKFEHLSPNNYSLYTFNDLNKDLTFQFNEKVGFSDSILNLAQSISDSIAFNVFSNKLPGKIKEKKLVYPRQVIVSATFPLKKSDFYYKDSKIDSSNIYLFREDSVAILLPEQVAENNLLLIKTDNRIDSLAFIAIQKNTTQKPTYTLYPSSKDLSRLKFLRIIFSDEIKEVNQELCLAFTKDSVRLIPTLSIQKNTLIAQFSDTLKGEITFKILAGAILFYNESLNDAQEHKLQFKHDTDFGSMLIKANQLPANTLLEFMLDNKLVRTISKQELEQQPLVTFLDPGDYSFRVIHDVNQNGKWDTGDVFLKKQAEKIDFYTQKVKIRANWETEVELESTAKSN